MIVDAHSHVERKTDGTLYSPAEFVAGMERGGIDVSIIFGNDQSEMGKQLGTAFSDSETAAFCAAAPKRLVGVSSVHPDSADPAGKVRRAVEEFGLRAVKLYPHSGFYVNDPRLFPVYEYCSATATPVIFHTGIKALRQQFMKYNRPLCADDVATLFPQLKLVLCHGGYPWQEEFMAVAGSNPNVYVDLTFLDYIEGKFALPGLAENTIRRLAAIVGARRLIWGSEGPFMNLPLYGRHAPDNYQHSMNFLVNRFDFFNKEEKKLLLGGNAVELFKLAQPPAKE